MKKIKNILESEQELQKVKDELKNSEKQLQKQQQEMQALEALLRKWAAAEKKKNNLHIPR